MKDIPFIRPLLHLMLNIISVVFFFLDVGLDIWAVKRFYQQQEYISMGVLIFLLLGSSMLLQAFSWLWYNYSIEEERNCLREHAYLKKYLKNRPLLGVLHVCQLGVILRFAGVLEIAVRNLTTRTPLKEDIAMYLRHDLSMLRLIESFSENAPQLIFMIAIISQREDVDWVKVLKALVSFVAIAINVLMYHRSMRSLSKSKTQLTSTSSLVYFLWNLLLIIPRVVAVALVASTLPLWMTAVHFICLWLTLLLWVWRQETDFMDHPVWEWFYRATVALIWYFSWFSVSKGRSKGRNVIYHTLIAVDITLLMVLWWWFRDQDVRIFGMSALEVCIVVAAFYSLGIIVKIVYHKLLHPKQSDTEQSGDDEGAPAHLAVIVMDSPTTTVEVDSPPRLTRPQRRMQKMAANFYS
ncbi:hypothetical protein ACEWY4_024257 [Coilia grayii]|uniref:XK-related protein n=1 Tax=Coilia grayii TaxID=363190 RepID=A0ABD1IZW0_9TELE